jgi:hypothetical protein
VILLLVSTFGAAAWMSFEASQERSPRIRVAMRQSIGSESRIVCLLNSSPNFAAGMAISFFVTNPQGFEVQIGVGAVTAIQENGYIQIALLASASGYEEIVTKLGNNEQNTLQSVRVRPFVSYSQIAIPSNLEQEQ